MSTEMDTSSVDTSSLDTLSVEDIEDGGTRRTEGVRVRGRSARVVSEVMVATAEELGRVGYSALRIEDVAEKAGVNKTTIYRRWPTKSALVSAALRHHADAEPLPDTGVLRDDLLASLRRMIALWSSPIGKGLVRMIQSERLHPEVEAITQERRAQMQVQRMEMIERAFARDELPAGTNGELVIELVFSPVMSRLLRREPVTDDYLESIVEFVMAGAKAGHAVLKS